MSHSYPPVAASSQMDENKQDLPKKLVEPFGSSCQFESAGNGALSLSERKKEGIREREGERGQKWRWSWLGGGCVGGGGIVQAKESPVTRAGSFMLSGSPLQLSSGAICSVSSLQAPPGY